MRRLLFLAAVLCFFGQDATAQLIMRQTSRSGELPPKALLVLLPYGTGRIKQLQDLQRLDLAKQLEKDLAAIRALMVEDYNTYFNYCPYYFVADSNAYKLRDLNFDGILLDSALNIVKSPVITQDDNTHMITYFGYRSRDSNETIHTITGSYSAMYNGDGEVMIPQMVVCDYRMKQLNRPLPRTPEGGYISKYTLVKPRYMYKYSSKVFDLSYRLSSPYLSARLKHFYGAYPYQNAP